MCTHCSSSPPPFSAALHCHIAETSRRHRALFSPQALDFASHCRGTRHDEIPPPSQSSPCHAAPEGPGGTRRTLRPAAPSALPPTLRKPSNHPHPTPQAANRPPSCEMNARTRDDAPATQDQADTRNDRQPSSQALLHQRPLLRPPASVCVRPPSCPPLLDDIALCPRVCAPQPLSARSSGLAETRDQEPAPGAASSYQRGETT